MDLNKKSRERKEIDEYLKSIYYDPQHEASFSSPEALYSFVKRDKQYKMTRGQIKDWLQWQDVYTSHISKRKTKYNSPVVVPYLRYQYDVDSGVLPTSYKNGMKYFVLVIDVFSRKVGARGVRNLKANTVKNALHEIFEELGLPERVRTDQGGEYINKEVEKMMEEMGITHFIAYPPNKANYAERAIRTVKNLLFKQMQSKGTKQWTQEMLQDTVDGYNNRKHRSIGMAPNMVSDANESFIWNSRQQDILQNSPPKPNYKFDINDSVRVELYKQNFSKDYQRKFSDEIYYVSGRNAPYNIPRYRVKTIDNVPVAKSYLGSELQKVYIDENTAYKIERIISRKNINGVPHVRVRWEGYSPKFDTWIEASEVKQIGGVGEQLNQSITQAEE